MTPPLTVLILARNAERYMPAAIDSVFAQTFTDFEILVVYDDSTDRTMELLEAYQKQDPRFRWIQGRNEGLAAARALGLQSCRTPWVALLDTDDLWEPRKTEVQMAVLRENPDLAAIASWGWYVGPRGIRSGKHTLGPLSRAEWSERRARGIAFVLLTSSVILAREPAVRCLEPRPSINAAEDALLFTRLAALGPIVTVPERLATYRVHPAGVSAALHRRQRMLLRWIDHNLARELAGSPWISEQDFEAAEAARGWFARLRTSRRDFAARIYRTGAAWLADRRHLRGCLTLLLALVVSPGIVLRKLRNQIFSSGPRHAGRSA